jgi:AraC family ethanolamine operon transcriptional activator
MSWALSRRLDDFEDFQSVFAQWTGAFRQMSRGEFRGAVQVASGGLLRVFQAETNQSILTRGLDSSPYVTFIPIIPENAATVWQGRRLSEGQLIVKGPEVEYHNQTGRNTTIRCLLLPVQTLQDAARVLAGNDAAAPVASWTAPSPSRETMSRFERTLTTLLTQSLRDPGILGSPEGDLLEGECLRALIDALADSSADVRTRLRPVSRSKLVRRAVDFVHEGLDKPVTALELCGELGVSDRMLRRAFREEFGLGPLAYFRLMRMHEVRAALRAARGGDEAVADIVRRWGFQRLGSFAAEYRRQFGELPSETLGVRGWPGIRAMTRRGV